MVFQFKIQIKGITKPPVWREIAVPANFTFLKFHDVIQTAFGWDDYHLFEFQDKEWDSNLRISIPHEDPILGPDLNVGMMHAAKTKLSDIFSDKFRKLLYIYDFGDNWTHQITLESISADKQKKAVCLSGKGACPPEDCGGIYGYEEIKEVFATMPESEKAEELREWLAMGEEERLDPKAFDIEEINIRLALV